MKSKILFFLAILSLSTYTSDAQIKKWLNKQKTKIENNSLFKKTKEYVKEIDPQEYLIKKINSNYKLNSYVNNINRKYNQLEMTLKSNINLYGNSNFDFNKNFSTQNVENLNLRLLDLGKIESMYPKSVKFNGIIYNVYSVNGDLIAVSKNKMPINSDLESIIKSVYWSNQIQNLNPSYISNLKSFSTISSEYYGYMLLFYDSSINIFNKIGDLGYKGFTARKLIDDNLRKLGYNFSISNTESTFNQLRLELKSMQDLSDRIYQKSNDFLIARERLLKSNSVDYKELENSLNGFLTISNEINKLADQVADQKRIIIKKRVELTKLSNFYGISFLESIGGLYRYLENYYTMIENGTRKHAVNFNDFVKEINSSSIKMYNKSKAKFDKISNSQINKELPNIEELLSLQKELTNSELKNLKNDRFIIYLNQVSKMYSDLGQVKTKDFIQFYNIKKDLKKIYNEFPTKNAINYYSSILNNIDEKQIIGGKYLESYFATYQKQISAAKEDKSKIKYLLASSKLLDNYYENAKSNNFIFFIVIGVLFLILFTIFIIRYRKNKKLNEQ